MKDSEGLESIWNSSGIHLDEFSAQEVEYGVFLKDFDDFEEFPNILDNPEGRIETNRACAQSGLGAIGIGPNPDWAQCRLRPIRIGRKPDLSQSGLGQVPIRHSGLSRMLGNCSKS